MSHHYSGPNVTFPRGDARLDFTDLFAFPKPEDPSKSILIMNVHPSVGVNPPGPTTDEPFTPEARYEIQIAKKFSGKYLHRTINGGIGHNLPQEAPKAFADAVVEVDGY